MRERSSENWGKKKELQKSSEKKVGGRRCRSTVTMRYERNALKHMRSGEKYRIAKGEDELFRRAEWIADFVSKRAAGEVWIYKCKEQKAKGRRHTCRKTDTQRNQD